jgi:hemerythrin-like domain-containing protein
VQYRRGEIAMENRVETNNTECIHATHQSEAACGCSHHHFEKATEILGDEHRVIERVLAVLQKLATRPVENSLDCWRKALDFFSRFADQCHHLKEEKILFPAMEEHGIPRDGGPIGMMLIEHEEGRGYVRTMMAALTLAEARNEAAKDTLLDNARAYLRLLREHIQFCGNIYKRKMRFFSGSRTMSFLPMSKKSCCALSKNTKPKRWEPGFMRSILRLPRS